MKYNDFSYKMVVEPYTPVYIGGASEKNLKAGLDIIKRNSEVYVLDQEKIGELLKKDEKLIINYTKAALENSITDFIKDLCLQKKITLNELSCRTFKYSLALENDIKAFIRNGLGKAFIPGSSLKGAIRSTLFHNLFKESEYSSHEVEFRGKDKKQIDRDEFIFGSIENNLMKYIHISDVPFTLTQIVNSKVFSLIGYNNLRGGWKHGFRGPTNPVFEKTGFTVPYEVLCEDQKGTGSIVFNKSFFDFVSDNKKETLPPNISKIATEHPLKTIFSYINNYTKKHLEREIKFFNNYENDRTNEINEALKKLKTAIPAENNSCLLRLGGGSGFHSVTGDWQFETHEITQLNPRNRGQYKRKDSAKTRKIAFIQDSNDFKFYPFGFVKITLISDEEYEKLQNEIAQISIPAEEKIFTSNIGQNQQPDPSKPKQAPKPYNKEKLKQGADKVPAKVIKSGKPNRVKLFIDAEEIEMPLSGYRSELETGKYIYVRITIFKNNKIEQVNYENDIK